MKAMNKKDKYERKWTEPKYGYTSVFPEDGQFCVNRQDEYVGMSYTVVWCPTRDAADAARRLLEVR